MANPISAVTEYCPKLKPGEPVEMPELLRRIAGRSTASEGDVELLFRELQLSIQEFNAAGRSVKVKGIGRFRPSINLAGEIKVNYTIDGEINSTLNKKNYYTGTIYNKEHIGKTRDELIALWNEEHPDDLIPVT
jgi:hypothetical protein